MAKGGKSRIEFFGTSELLKKIEKAGGNVEKACEDALRKSVQKPKAEMLEYLTNKPHPYSTGQTKDSFTEEIKTENGKIYCEVGFSIRKGGLAALFLNLGTPKIKPSFFVDNAIDHNIDEIKRVQLEALKEAFRELQ